MPQHDIQKDIVCAAAMLTTNAITKDIGDEFFSILVDVSCDASLKDQMAIVLRYVKEEGKVVECLLGIVHIENTDALTLKAKLGAMLSSLGLSISKLCGQGYDCANSVLVDCRRLNALILKENTSAFYLHCFAHQLQLALVAVTKKHPHLDMLFSIVSMITNVVRASDHHFDILEEAKTVKILDALEHGEHTIGKWVNQESVHKRPTSTCWSYRFHALVNLIHLYPSVVVTLQSIYEDEHAEKKGDALLLLEKMRTFDFALSLFLMRDILGVSFDLLYSLQRSDQDIVNALELVRFTKLQLQLMRIHRWDSFLKMVSSFCSSHDIVVPDMDEIYIPLARSRRVTEQVTNLHHYRYELFSSAIDCLLQELNNHFTERDTELLHCMRCLSPRNSFKAYDKGSLLRLAELYPRDFSSVDIQILGSQLDSFIDAVRAEPEFHGLNGLIDVAKMMVKTKKDEAFHLVYKLVKLVLVCPVTMTSVKRVISTMNIVESEVLNRMGNQWLNDSLVTYIESRFFATVPNTTVEHS